ncbi:hypothetical protein JCGZ_20156 [Jatropha curcas]|uniref:Uncharacterized protein n=1 Tax=Jatropha curcas TaxID=180498 RepID=A0A067JU73_JATCU|nr:hypothetical protein JCGZ_20156 [Jatropha curcas]
MARGRAFDSDASDSVLRGGRGQGRSTRGRGGTIPPPSSGTSRAASSAQPPVPPSLLFLPLLPNFLDQQSLHLLHQPCNKLSLVAGYIYPSSRASRQIMRIIKLHLDKDGYTWDAASQEKHFIWEEAITAMLKVAWEKLCVLQYADFTYRMRKSGKKQQRMSQEIWQSW